MASIEHKTWMTENYIYQKRNYWPSFGKHILAQFDDDTIVVYQAFNPAIAKYAVEHQRFGGEQFSFTRMSWIKTNFLWMMYRCGWASKKNQERVLAVRITRDGFAKILSQAWTGHYQKSHHKGHKGSLVRLQWDPDHSPNYGNTQRRAIQLGLKGQVLEEYGTQMVVSITDVTDFVKDQYSVLRNKGQEHIEVARERVFTDVDPEVAEMIELDKFDLADLTLKNPSNADLSDSENDTS